MARSSPGGANVAPRVLQQRDEVVGRMADRGGLEVDDAGAAGAGALRQPEQVAGEEVAVHEAARTGLDGASIASRAAAKSPRAAGGGLAPKIAGHHQSNSVPSAACAMAGASQAGRSRGGAARWRAIRTSTAEAIGEQEEATAWEEEVVVEDISCP